MIYGIREKCQTWCEQGKHILRWDGSHTKGHGFRVANYIIFSIFFMSIARNIQKVRQVVNLL